VTGCVWCGHYHAQKCHVRDKASFSLDELHDHFNIVLLCAACHDHYFDRGRMGFTEDCRAIVVLRCKTFRKLEIRAPQYCFHVQPAYVAWKNVRAHSYVKAKLRELSLLADDESDCLELA
jgi:hypothetical protein